MKISKELIVPTGKNIGKAIINSFNPNVIDFNRIEILKPINIKRDKETRSKIVNFKYIFKDA